MRPSSMYMLAAKSAGPRRMKRAWMRKGPSFQSGVSWEEIARPM